MAASVVIISDFKLPLHRFFFFQMINEFEEYKQCYNYANRCHCCSGVGVEVENCMNGVYRTTFDRIKKQDFENKYNRYICLIFEKSISKYI